MHSFLVFFACFATCAYTIENDVIYENCSSQIRKELATVHKCIGRATEFEVTPLLYTIVKSIKENETTSEAAVEKYCPMFKKVYPCANLFTGGSKECRNEPSIVQLGTETNITTTLMLSILDLACGENGANVVDQFIADDLLTYVGKQSDSFRDCIYLFEDRPIRYRNAVQKRLFTKAVKITTSCLGDYFKAEGKYFLRALVVRLGKQFNQNLEKSII